MFYFRPLQSQYLYDPALLEHLNFSRSTAKFSPPISAVAPGEPWLLVRPLCETDFDRGFLKLLAQLTAVGHVTRTEFLSKFCFTIRLSNRHYFFYYI